MRKLNNEDLDCEILEYTKVKELIDYVNIVKINDPNSDIKKISEEDREQLYRLLIGKAIYNEVKFSKLQEQINQSNLIRINQ